MQGVVGLSCGCGFRCRPHVIIHPHSFPPFVSGAAFLSLLKGCQDGYVMLLTSTTLAAAMAVETLYINHRCRDHKGYIVHSKSSPMCCMQINRRRQESLRPQVGMCKCTDRRSRHCNCRACLVNGRLRLNIQSLQPSALKCRCCLLPPRTRPAQAGLTLEPLVHPPPRQTASYQTAVATPAEAGLSARTPGRTS